MYIFFGIFVLACEDEYHFISKFEYAFVGLISLEIEAKFKRLSSAYCTVPPTIY
jgi:hypothetical protein